MSPEAIELRTEEERFKYSSMSPQIKDKRGSRLDAC